jgi:hypothetical protein
MFKVMNLVVRTVAKPLISWVTHYKKLKFKDESQSKFKNYARNKLIWTGQTWNYYNVVINRKLFKISTLNTTVTELSEEKALDRGAEIIGEIIVYSLLIIIPLIEWYRLSNISKKKESVKEEFIKETRILLDELINESREINNELNEIKNMLDLIDCKIENNNLI